MTTYDVHAHAIVPEAVHEMRASHPDHAPTMVTEEGVRYLAYPGRARLGPLPPGITDPAQRLADMKAQRVDVQVIAIAPPNYHYHYHYHVPAPVGVEFARIQNDHLLALSDAHPEQFQVFGTLPLQDVPAAVAEIERLAPHARVRGVQIGTNIDGVDLDHPDLEPVWAALASHDMPVWVHGDQRALASADRLGRYYLQNLIGQPLESTIAMGRLIFGGVLERHPDLRFGWVHGGGFTPYQIGRWDHGWGCRPEPRVVVDATPPRTYFERMYFDTLTHDALSLGTM
jgi:aminocarboxymuconate-semialdehyde decarboxylase